MLRRLVLVCSFALVWTTSNAMSALAWAPATAGVQGRAQRDQNRTCAGALVERRVQFFDLTGARAGAVVGSNPRSTKKSVRHRAGLQHRNRRRRDDANQATTEEIGECKEADPDPAWSPECWGHPDPSRSSVDKGLSCNCLGPMDKASARRLSFEVRAA